ncbi:MAG TPA: pitrilysin family protein [Anaerolineales bacterium]|nr:pitrilysin family protein [Anaerolineales bacterium]
MNRTDFEDHIEAELDNGLKLLIKPIPTAPIISHWMWYRVGSRDEAPGKTGLSHWVEHMQFKGTPNHSSEEIEREIARKGGMWNAFTFFDWTTYYASMPAAEIDGLMRFEADRMRNTAYSPDEVESERAVILSELEGSENDPTFKLSRRVQEALIQIHPYHHEVIGTREDLQAHSYHDLLEHYHRYYRPSNAVLTIAGDLDPNQMLDKVAELYVNIPDSAEPRLPIQRVYPTDLPNQSEQVFEVEGPGDTVFVEISYPTLPAAHPDTFALIIFDSLLSGPTNMNMFGGGSVSNKTSRLFKALIDSGLAMGAGGGSPITIDPFLYTFNLTLRPEQSVQTAISALDEQIERLQNEPVGQEQIARAIKQAKAIFAYGAENITNQAFWLGHAEMFANYSWFQNYLLRLEEVTPADLTRVARQCFSKQQRAVGIYLPNGQTLEETW